MWGRAASLRSWDYFSVTTKHQNIHNDESEWRPKENNSAHVRALPVLIAKANRNQPRVKRGRRSRDSSGLPWRSDASRAPMGQAAARVPCGE